MYRYIALLRGINVGGHRKLPMTELRSLLESLGYSNVKTYIQSGNAVFSSEEEVEGSTIAKAIEEKFGYDVPVLLRTPLEIAQILKDCPFPKEKKEKGYFGLLYKPPTAKAIETTRSFSFSNEEFVITPQCVYLFFHDGYGKSKMPGNFFEKNLEVPVTTRNFRTMMKLLELASS